MAENTNEVWKPIKDYEGWYEASTLGRIRSVNRSFKDKSGRVRTFKGRVLKPAKVSKKGYLGVMLCRNGSQKTKKVHRLVAETFLPNPSNLPEVNHKDENVGNNCVDNLEWATTKYNCRYGTRSQRIGENNKKPKRKYTVYQLDKEDNVVKVFDSVRQASKQTGICYDSIRKCGLGEPYYKTAGGYKWKMVPKEPEKCAFDIE